MNVRSIAIIGLVIVMSLGLLMLLRDMLQPAAAPRRVQTALAAQQIEPYTVITQDMILASEWVDEKTASEKGAYPVDAVVGLMSTSLLQPGTQITGVNAKPIREVRWAEDLGLEIVSFAADISRAIGGQLRPGHIINLYGTGRDDKGKTFTTLIEPQLWVVDVSASGRPVTNMTPMPDVRTGEYVETGGDRDQPATLVMVAVTPDKAVRIIDALGSQGMSAYVTLSASQVSLVALATPLPATPTVGLPPGLSETATALWLKLQMTAPPPPPITGGGGGTR